MRTLRIVTASTLLASAALVVPVVSVGAAPHAVKPSVERVPMPAAQQVSTVAGATASEGSAAVQDAGAQLAESVLTRDTDGADVVGVGFPDAASAKGVTVSVRSKVDGHWGSWNDAGVSESAPDPGSAEAAQAKVATEPVGVTGSQQVQIRVRAAKPGTRLDRLQATFVDGGTSAADSSVASTPAATAGAAAVKPEIITRAQWGADESLRNCSPDYVDKVKGAIVHHTVNSNTYSAEQAAGLVRGIYAYHVNGNGWCDIGYQFLVDRFGRLYEGRFGGDFRNVVGAQAQGFNMQSFGISSIANHDPNTSGAAAPSAAVLTAIGKLIGWKSWLNGWDPATSVSYTSAGSSRWPEGTVITKPRVSGHRDFNLTSCPGDLMFNKLSTIRSTATSSYKAGMTAVASEVSATSVVETYTRPSGTSFSLSGRGFGHGRGMSQYGAYGAALSGLTRDQILAFYYPGTTRSTAIGNPTVRVNLTALGSSSTQLVTSPNLVITDGSRTGSLFAENSDGSLRERWRVVADGTGLTLQWLQSGTWRSTSSWKSVTTPLSFSDTKLGKVRVMMPDGTQRDYRRTVRSVRSGTGVMTLSVVPMNYYLQSVVPSEMPPSWSPAALETQAVAARTYAAYEMAHRASGSSYDLCDSTACQVYKGLAGYTSSGTLVPHENAASTAAVTATNGLGVFYGGAPAFTQFGSSNGGQTAASSLAYQVSKVDPYDNVPSGSSSRWTTSISISSIEKAYPTVGTLKALRIDKRDGINAWGGRIASVTVLGSAGSKTVTGDSFRSTFGLRSTWWTVTSAPAKSAASYPKDLDGNELGDLLAVDTSGRLRLLSGNGASAFTVTTSNSGWSGYGLIADVGSWDGDNRHDVVERDQGTLYYHPGNGAGGFYSRVAISSGWDTINLVAGAGDMDRDGHTDFLARTTTGQLKVYRGDGRGKATSTILVGSGWNAYRAVLSPGDLTGDGKLDVLAVRTSDDAMLLFPGTGTGTVGTPTTVSGSWAGYSKFIAPGDVSGDGRDDVVARRTSDGALVVFKGTDMGTLAPGSTVAGTDTWATWTTWPL